MKSDTNDTPVDEQGLLTDPWYTQHAVMHGRTLPFFPGMTEEENPGVTMQELVSELQETLKERKLVQDALAKGERGPWRFARSHWAKGNFLVTGQGARLSAVVPNALVQAYAQLSLRPDSSSFIKERDMDLDATGWPRLPSVGSRIQFRGGGVLLQCLGVCTIVRADHVCNATGRPGGRVTVEAAGGQLVEVKLSHVRDYAVLLSDGLQMLELEAQRRWAREYR